MNICHKAVFFLFASGIGFNQIAAANDTDEWQFEFTPYLLAASMDGTVGVQGHTFDVDASFNDILEDLDTGFMGLITAQKYPWFFGLEGVYMKLENEGAFEVTGPGGIVSGDGKLDVTNSMYVLQGSVGYRLIDSETKLDAIGAIRYTKLEADIDIKVDYTPPIFDGNLSADGSDSWADLVAGMRVLHPITKDVSLVGYADIGAGGSDLTYQIIAGLNWEFKKGLTAKVGYRHLYWDYKNDGTVWDVAATGPYLGLGLQF